MRLVASMARSQLITSRASALESKPHSGSGNCTRFAGFSGESCTKGVCPAGLADDWLSFWAKLDAGGCTGVL